MVHGNPVFVSPVLQIVALFDRQNGVLRLEGSVRAAISVEQIFINIIEYRYYHFIVNLKLPKRSTFSTNLKSRYMEGFDSKIGNYCAGHVFNSKNDRYKGSSFI